jgi:pimeloyl-ACP methyl ester carboxylesterase
VPVSLSMAAQWALWLMARRPERVAGSVFIGPSLALAPGYQGREQPFEEPYTSTEGWAKFNRHYWQDHYQDFLAGPRIDPASLPQADGLEVHPYVHGLYRHLAACDLAVVQGGLTTTPEVVADAIAAEIGREVDYRPVETGGAARAAGLIAEVLWAP